MFRVRLIQLTAAMTTLLTCAAAQAAYYAWHASCTSENWHACCEDPAGHYNNWWFGPYTTCPTFPGPADDVETNGSAVYLTLTADVWSFHSSGVFKLYDAGLAVRTVADFDGPFEWNAGSLATGVFNINSTADLRTGGGKWLAGARLNVNGAAVASISSDLTLNMHNHALIDIAPLGRLEVQTATIIQSTFGSTVGPDGIHVRGELRKILSPGLLDITVPFDNDGLVKVLTGTLRVKTSYADSSGVFDLATGTTLESAQMKMSAGTTFPNDGLLKLPTYGLLEISSGADILIPRLELNYAAQRRGDGRIRVSNTLDWRGDGMVAPGYGINDILAGATASLSTDSDKLLVSQTLNNAGSVTWTGNGNFNMVGGDVPAYFNNFAGAAFDIRTDADIIPFCCGIAGEYVSNAGLLKKSTGAGITDVYPTFTNTGVVEARSGTLNFMNYVQTAGATRLLGGKLATITYSYPLTISGGVLDGSGEIAGHLRNDGGEVRPGLSPGTIRCSGPLGYFTQTPGGTLAIEIGGPTPGTSHDQVLVDQYAMLGGTLRLTLINGFIPSPGSDFTVLTAYFIYGAFDSLVLTNFPAGLTAEIVQTSSAVTVHISSAAPSCASCPGDLNADGRVTGLDISAMTACLVSGSLSSSCACADINSDLALTAMDASLLVSKLLTDVDTLCP